MDIQRFIKRKSNPYWIILWERKCYWSIDPRWLSPI